jgi:glycosyltransferase involved in cell wall biosynthesis
MAIRVLHIIGSLHLGGAQIVLKQIVEHSDPVQFEHFVYPLRPANPEISITKNVLSHSRFNYDPRKLTDILRICRERQFDIIHTHLHKDAVIGLTGSFFQNIPVVVHEHGAIFLPGPQYAGFRILLRTLRGRATAFIANSQASARQLTKAAGVSPSKITVIYNAVDPAVFQPDPDMRKKIRTQLKIPDNAVVIGFVGRLHRDKGIDLLVEAIGTVCRESPNFRLLILGSGPMKNDLHRRAGQLNIAPNVYFVGFQPDIAEWLNAFDIGCLPSRNESFGLAAVEMMAMNIPLVCTDVGGLAELTAGGKNAVVLKQNSPRRIAAEIQRLNADTALRTQISKNAFEFAKQFSVETFIQKIETLYSNLMENRGGTVKR